MVRKQLGALVLAACIAVPLVGEPASAAPPTDLYVDNTDVAAKCSDAGTGTQAQPYCTLGAAAAVVTAGQTVNVIGEYNEHLTITTSGTPDSPITFRSGSINHIVKLSAPVGGITIDGQHDVSIIGFLVTGTLSAPGVAVSNSGRIALERVQVLTGSTTSSPVAPGIQLNAVTDSSVVKAIVSGTVTAGITLDAATERVLVKSSYPRPYKTGKGIEIYGSSNTIVDADVFGSGVAGISIEPGARDNVIANSLVSTARGRGIHNAGATGTAITNNTVANSCGTGIRVDGKSSGVSVQNNVATGNGSTSAGCDPSIPDGVNIGVYDDAVHGTVVDYNRVSGGSDGAYAWATPMGLAAFQAASGQAAHDVDSPDAGLSQDSANSAAPGWQSKDFLGQRREDNPGKPNTGAGPINYADRGRWETIGTPTARVTITVPRTRTGTSITVDATGSTTWFPTTITKYTFDFGDGTTVTQSTPIATHLYRQLGAYQVSVTVTATNGLVGSAATQWTYPVAPRRPTVSPRPPAPHRNIR